MKRYLLVTIVLFLSCALHAQHVRVVAPKHVVVGEEFQVEYTIYTQDVRRFQLGRLSSGLEKVYGPATSSQSNYQFINGHASSSSSMTFTYVFVASKKGTHSIAPAKIVVNGQELASTPVRLTASGNSTSQRSNPTPSYRDVQSDNRTSTDISSKDLFIKVSANKTTVYEQEPVLLTYKVYTTRDLRQLVGKMPDLSGFHVQEVDLPQQKTFHRERVGNTMYNCVTWSQYVMYPQVTGSVKIPAITFHALIRESTGFNPFEAFGIDAGSTNIKKDIQASGLTLRVLPLPTRPADFSGGVGHLNLSAQLNKKEVKAGDPITIRVVVSGVGNLKLIKQPIIQLPKGVEAYDMKVTDKTHLTSNGVEGNMIYDQVVVPSQEGVFSIPPVKLNYYDLVQKKYINLQTQPLDLKVLRGDGSAKNIISVNLPNEDILPIKTEGGSFDKVANSFFGSVSYFFLLCLLLGCGIVLSICYRQRFTHHVDLVLRRGKNANRVASGRLQSAKLLMLKGKNIEFYDEIQHALWGYISDKLNLPLEQLSRDSISDQLNRLEVSSDVVDDFVSAIDECEFQRYAPGDEKGNMQRTLDAALTAIANMDNELRQNKKDKKKMNKTLLLLAIMVLCSSQLFAQDKDAADRLYEKGNYKQAVKQYEALLKEGESAALYYNLGNSYYRLDDIPNAVLSYERAQRLSPGDEDIRFNLQLAQAKTIDKFSPESEMFFLTWYKAFVCIVSADSWAILGLICLSLSLVSLVVYLFVEEDKLRKYSKITFPLFLGLFVINTVFATQQVFLLNSTDYGIIMSSSAVVRNTPDTQSKQVVILHEGSKVKIKDLGLKEWVEVQLSDGRSGWIPSKSIEAI